MGNAVGFATGTGLISRDELAASLNNAAMSMPRVGGDYQYLKMDKGNGDWIYGQEETVVEKDALWAINPSSLQHGFISWDRNQQVEGEVMVPISRPRPNTAELRVDGSPDGRPTGHQGWQFQMSVDMVCISGEDEGTVCQYKQSSVGAMKAFHSLIDALNAQLARKSDAIVPVVTLTSSDYKHKKYGRIYNPIFDIKEWRTMDDTSAPSASATAKASAETDADGDDEEAALAREYEAEQQRQAEQPAPRRRVRR